MDALLVCSDEIALEGLDGCPFVSLWSNLEERSPPFQMKLDDSSKDYLWRGIVEVLDISFYLLETPLPRIFCYDEKKSVREYLKCSVISKGEGFDLAMGQYNMINDGKIRGSCPEYHTRKNITSEIRSTSGQCLLSLTDAQKRWGDRLVMVASQNMRNKALFNDDVDPNICLSDVEYGILEHVGQSRMKGRLTRCANIFLNLDARSTFHHVKKMQKLGLITKQPISIQSKPAKNICSNIVKLKRFYSPLYHKYDMLGHQMCQKLEEEPDKMMLLKDLKEFLKDNFGLKDHLIKKVRQHLQDSGHIEIFTRQEQSIRQSTKTKPPGKQRCYARLIKPFLLVDSSQVGDNDGDNDEDDDDDIQDYDGQPNFVVERSFIKQMYDFIESKAENGVCNKVIGKETKIPFFEHRAMVKFLEKEGYVKHVLTYAGRQTMIRFVAAPFLEANYHLSKILEEKKKMEGMKSVVATASPLNEMATKTPIDSPCPSPTPSTQSAETIENDNKSMAVEEKKVQVQSKSALAGKVTYRMLKRKTFIVEYLEKHKIVNGFIPILKSMREAEEKEGLESKLDRRFLMRTLVQLVEEGLIKKLTTVIGVNETNHTIEFYLHPSVNPQDPVVQVAIDQTRFRLYGEPNRSEPKLHLLTNMEILFSFLEFILTLLLGLRENSRKKKRKMEPDVEPSEDEVKDVDPDKIISNHYLRYNYGYLAKFPRMRLFHEFLWQVLFGNKQRQETKTGNTAGELETLQRQSAGENLPSGVKYELMTSGSMDSGSKEPEGGNSKVTKSIQGKKELSSGEFDSKTHDYNWVKYLEPLPLYDLPEGWLKLCDTVPIMPLSVYCSIMGIVTEVEGLDDYFNDPKLKHTLVKDLPPKMQKLLKFKGRYKTSLAEIVSCLMCAGLLVPKKPLPAERLMTEVHFNRGGILKDTSTSLPHFDEIEAPPNKPFNAKKFVFKTFSDVQSYWDDLKCFCLNTPLGVIRAKENRKTKRWFKFINSEAPVMLENSIVPPPGNGKGACGFDSFLHLHLSRNWSFSRGFSTRHAEMISGEPPAKKLKKGDNEIPKKTKKVDSKKTEKSKPKPKPKPKPKAKRPSIEDIIIRPPKRPKNIEPPSTRRTCFSDSEKRKQTLNAGKHLIAADDVDRKALTKTVGLRKCYSQEVDKILILCRIGLEIMKKTSYRNPYPFTDIRNIVHEHCENELDKTAPNCQKRLQNLMKNPKNVTTINVCVAEYSLSEEFLGLDNPDLPFSETFHTLVNKLISRNRAVCLEDTSQLSSSLDELYQKYYVQRIVLPGELSRPTSEMSVLGPAVETVKDIRFAIARDVILISSHSKQANTNTICVFKMFDDLKVDEKDYAFEELQKTCLINRKRDYNSSLRRTVPFAAISYQLSQVYNRYFQPSGIQVSTFEESIAFLKQLNGSPEIKTFIQVSPRPIKLSEEHINGGEAASVLSLLAAGKITIEFHLPDHILQKDEKQQDNLATKRKSTPFQTVSSLVTLKQYHSKQKTNELGESTNLDYQTEGKLVNKSRAKAKQTRAAAKKKSECKLSDSGEDSANGDPSYKDDSTGDETKMSKTRVKKKPKFKEADKSTSKNDSNKDESKSDSDRIIVDGEEFLSPRGMSKEKVQNILLVSEEEQGEKQSTEAPKLDTASFDFEKKESTKQDKDKKGKQGNEQIENGGKGKQIKTDNMDEALEDPFLDNNLSVHCKFSSITDHSSIKNNAFTPVYCSTMPSTPYFDTQDQSTKTIAQRLLRVGRMKSKGLAQPMLLTNTNDFVFINNCSVFVRSKVTVGNNGNVSDDPMDTQGGKLLDILSPGPLEIILKSAPTLDAYLDTCGNTEGFNACDIQLCSSIWKAAEEGKELGTTMKSLKQMFHDKASLLDQACYSLEEHVKKLCSVKLLLKVGIYTRRFVCPSFARPWCINFMKSKTDVEEQRSEVNSSQPDSVLPNSSPSESSSISASATTESSVQHVSPATTLTTTESMTTQPEASVVTDSTNVQHVTPARTSTLTVQEATTTESMTTQPDVTLATKSTTVPHVTPATTSMTTKQAATMEPMTTQPEASVVSKSTIQHVTSAQTSTPVQQVPTNPMASTTTTSQSMLQPAITSVESSVPVTHLETSTTKESVTCNVKETISSVEELTTDITPETQSADLEEVMQKPCEENIEDSKKLTPDIFTRPSGKTEPVVSRPWLEVTGELNKVFLKSILSVILSEIMTHPGITDVLIAQKFVAVTRPVYLSDLLEYLEAIGCITKHPMSVSKPTSLFSTESGKKDIEKFIYYLPVVDCIAKLANVMQNWS